MGEPIKMRIREGCRGGSEQFTWNSLKEQEFKDRECYLGQSTKVGMMGKFGRYYLHDWYARKRDTADSINSEQAAVQAYEDELMQEALGLKPKRLLLAKRQLTPEEIKEFLKRDEEKSNDKKGHEVMGPQKKVVTNEHGEQVATSNEEFIAVAARDAPVKGIGFASHRTAKLEEIKARTFGTVGQLQGSTPRAPLAVKIEDDAKSEFGVGGTSSSNSGIRAKEEPKDEIKEEDVDPRGPSLKRCRVDRDSSEERRRSKAVKKEGKEEKREKKEKKRRKAEKKLRKAEKKLRKREKKAEAAREKEARRRAAATKTAPHSTSSSSSSSSDS